MELEKLQKILSKNAYPQIFVDKCIFKFLNGIFKRKPKVTMVPKKKLSIVFLKVFLFNEKIT